MSGPFSFGGASTGTFGTGTAGFGSGGGFGFGNQPKTTSTTGFGLGFGSTAASTAPSFGFGSTTTTASSAPSFGFSSTTASAPPSFGFGTTTTSAPSFGFGSTTSSAAPSFGFGGTSTATTGFGGLGGFQANTATTGFGLGTQAQQQQQVVADPAADELAKLSKAVSQPQVFGDERDAVLAKWNQLQAHWGKGKGYYYQQQFVEFKPDNVFCKFKAVGYNCMPSGKNEDGLVSMIIKHPIDMVRPQQQQALDTIHKIMGSRPQHTVCAEAINELPDGKTDLVVYVMDRPNVGPAKRCPAIDLFNYLSAPQFKTQLTSQLNVENLTPKVLMKDQLKAYLDQPPSGIDPLLWQQAILDNPDPEKMIPVPMIGFKELNQRLKRQDKQNKLHQQKLDLIAQDLTEFQNKQSNMLAKLDEYKRKYLELSHRTLQVIVKQEIHRKQGFAIQVDEEQLRVQLEAIQAELNHPTQFKGRLNELMSQIRMQNHLSSSRSDVNYQIDPNMLQELKTLLNQQQEGLTHLIDIVKEDMQDLNVIETGLTDNTSAKR